MSDGWWVEGGGLDTFNGHDVGEWEKERQNVGLLGLDAEMMIMSALMAVMEGAMGLFCPLSSVYESCCDASRLL